MPRVCPKCSGEMEATIIGENKSGDGGVVVKFECEQHHRVYDRIASAERATELGSSWLICDKCGSATLKLFCAPDDSMCCERCLAIIKSFVAEER